MLQGVIVPARRGTLNGSRSRGAVESVLTVKITEQKSKA